MFPQSLQIILIRMSLKFKKTTDYLSSNQKPARSTIMREMTQVRAMSSNQEVTHSSEKVLIMQRKILSLVQMSVTVSTLNKKSKLKLRTQFRISWTTWRLSIRKRERERTRIACQETDQDLIWMIKISGIQIDLRIHLLII